ncbi:MAG: type II toxin-antitoxin system RelE family toxin [Acidobacteriaceae bacterium]
MSKLDRETADLITGFLRNKVRGAEDARRFGHALSGNHKGRWRYRVGDYRIICELQDDILVVLVLGIGPRREVYR